MKIAHIVNPVKVTDKSDLFLAQPITFETMRKAKEFALLSNINIELYYTCYKYDLDVVPYNFTRAKLLEHSVLDIGRFKQKRNLPMLKDILDSLYNATDAEYLIYTNIDIALMPYFYVEVARLIEKGHDAFVINRRTISNQYSKVEDIAFMYSEIGTSHPGFDCFIFKRNMYPTYILHDICIGINWVGTVLLWNLQVFSKYFKILEDIHLTFHIGNDKTWKNPQFEDYVIHNKTEAKNIYLQLQKIKKSFNDEKHWKYLND